MSSPTPPHRTAETSDVVKSEAPPAESPGEPPDFRGHGWRVRVRSKPGLREAYRAGVFAAGLLCMVVGAALVVLPGPLTIPPVLLGLWIWSTEFRFAQRFLDAFKDKARDAWIQAKARPIASACVTAGGLLAAGAVLWAVSYYDLVERAKVAVL